MFNKKEFAINTNLRFISRTISCSAELSMKKSFINSGPRYQMFLPLLLRELLFLLQDETGREDADTL